MLKKVVRTLLPNPFDRLLKNVRQQGGKKILIIWNRGLGDIPLGLYALVKRIRTFITDASITFITRNDLKDGFALLKGVDAIASPSLKRGQPFDLASILSELHLSRESFDLVLERPDPTRWLTWQLGKLVPRLAWDLAWDPLCDSFEMDKEDIYAGVHVQTETCYSYEKNWPVQAWEALFKKLYQEKGIRCILFGFQPTPPFPLEGVIDLRGKTSLFEMLSIIKNRCKYLVVPDSGVLSLVYYLDVAFPIQVVSLWADPHQGVLRQKVASPNPLLQHHPLRGRKENISSIGVETVFQSLFPGVPDE